MARRPQASPLAVLLLVLAAAVSGVSAAGRGLRQTAATPRGADGELRIGCLLPLTGNEADTGLAIKAAIEMAIDQAAPARVPGVKVTLTCVDTRCGEVRALSGARKLARANADAVIGDLCSPATLAATAVAQKYQMPLLSPGATSPALSAPAGGARYFFRTVPSDLYVGGFAADAMLADGVERVVVVRGADDYGMSLSDAFIAEFSRRGHVAAPVPLDTAAAPASGGAALLAAVTDARANGVFVATIDADAGAATVRALRAAATAAGIGSDALKIYVGDAMASSHFAQSVGPALAAGVKAVDSWFAPSWPAEFADYVKSKGLEGRVAFTPKTAAAYDAAIAIMDAYRRAAAPKAGPQLRDELLNVKFAGKSGPVAFDESGDLVYAKDDDTYVSLIGFQPDGSMKIVATAASSGGASVVGAAKEGARPKLYASVAATHEALAALAPETPAEAPLAAMVPLSVSEQLPQQQPPPPQQQQQPQPQQQQQQQPQQQQP